MPDPLFRSPRIHVSLVPGALASAIEVERPQIHLVVASGPRASQTGLDADWSATVKRIEPMRLDRLVVQDGAIHFRGARTKPVVDLVEKGRFSMDVALDAKDGRLRGYVPPDVEQLDVVNKEEAKRQHPLKTLWQGLIDATAAVFENPRDERVAARIPISGSIENPKAGVWPAIGSLVRNAFVEGPASAPREPRRLSATLDFRSL